MKNHTLGSCNSRIVRSKHNYRSTIGFIFVGIFMMSYWDCIKCSPEAEVKRQTRWIEKKWHFRVNKSIPLIKFWKNSGISPWLLYQLFSSVWNRLMIFKMFQKHWNIAHASILKIYEIVHTFGTLYFNLSGTYKQFIILIIPTSLISTSCF